VIRAAQSGCVRICDQVELRMTPQETPDRLSLDAMPHRLDQWMYGQGRPNALASALNTMWKSLASAGLTPRRLAALEVRGRDSGSLRSFPVVVADYQGERYVVAMLGEGTNWVANVRAADGRAVLKHGRRQPVRLQEIEPPARAPILKRYLQLAPGARAHILVDRDAPLSEFERIADRHPAFRIESPAARDEPADR
jgi:F420H(2)-dependent quinone reductase